MQRVHGRYLSGVSVFLLLHLVALILPQRGQIPLELLLLLLSLGGLPLPPAQHIRASRVLVKALNRSPVMGYVRRRKKMITEAYRIRREKGV